MSIWSTIVIFKYPYISGQNSIEVCSLGFGYVRATRYLQGTSSAARKPHRFLRKLKTLIVFDIFGVMSSRQPHNLKCTAVHD